MMTKERHISSINASIKANCRMQLPSVVRLAFLTTENTEKTQITTEEIVLQIFLLNIS
jgi:hypothetical protein